MAALDGNAINSKLTYNISASSLEQVDLAAFYPENQTLGGVTVDLAEYSLPQDCAEMPEIVFRALRARMRPRRAPNGPLWCLGVGGNGDWRRLVRVLGWWWWFTIHL